MNRINRRQAGKGAIELIEEATHLLRSAPAAALAYYYIGTAPFVVGILYFWADMSRSPFAGKHLAPASLGLAGLFLWMKLWQGVFGWSIRQLATGQAISAPGWQRLSRILLRQLAVQPSGLFLLPLSLAPILPFPWAYCFYQNCSVLAGEQPGRVRELIKVSKRQAALWPRQNLAVLLVIGGFALFVFLNWTTVCLFAPALVRMLLGIESTFSRAGSGLFNTTFVAVMVGLTYLCVDPLLKTIYALRCFYGQSLTTGEDLKTGLKQVSVRMPQVAGCLLCLLAWACSSTALAADAVTAGQNPPTTVQGSGAGVSPSELDRAIEEVIQQNKYSWRTPRERLAKTEEKEPGIIGRFLERVEEMLKRWGRAIRDWLAEWLKKLFQRKNSGQSGGSGYGWIMTSQLLLYALLAVVIGGVLFLAFRAWHRRKEAMRALSAEPIHPIPDLADENIGAEQLPEDSWMRLARELLERGELRLALRAFYLASLAHLASRNLITLARFKSNQEYALELRRRAHAFPDLLQLFSENVSVFDRIWYGLHAINDALVSQFASNVERIKSPLSSNE